MSTLTDLKCRNASCKPGKKITKLAAGDNLYLWVFATGQKYWRFRFYSQGKEGLLSLGVYPATGLAEARRKAAALRTDLKAGKDPSQVRQKAVREDKQAQADTFEAFATEWYEARSHLWSAKYSKGVLSALQTHAFPILGRMPVKDIEAPDIIAVLHRVQATGATTQAFRLLRIIQAVLDFAINNGRLVQNVAVGREGALKAHKSGNRAHVSQKEFPELVRKISTYDQIGSREVMLALQLITLTFVRANELLQAEWTEFDFEEMLWEIPAVRMKTDRVLLVPLPPQVVAILKDLKVMNPNSRFILPGRGRQKGIASNSLLNALKLLGYGGKQTVHGFRHVASTYLNEAREGDAQMFDSDAIEMQLAHTIGGTRGRYNKAKYLAERRRIMTYWADYVCGLAEQDGKV
ncbi:integrase arm-type DNA-binding domain-containing protein [Pseudomonas sp. R5(2019)]|uniref:tyrosine-type recombinase/integrase n=1 Tax=Pseudomonas sp. R5(2019) TaxID=2697566 RepID=UPI001411F4A7|nr:integrase arm-type DNA-binding domain-containing protein [Pseudomonas sp. R5(2019)]NBA96295.1 integrase arm-type DNA-binding domain-containing protein [Pseudomonas sp. R5(2019)]